jgi:hypothetical protein
VKPLATLAFLLGAVATASSADTLTVRFDNPAWTPLSYDEVSISINNGSFRNVPASRHQATVVPPGLVSPTIDETQLIDSFGDLFMYCYDLGQYINHGETITYEIQPGAAARTLDFLGAVNYVLNNNMVGGDRFAWLHPSGPQAPNIAAAIQVGIWESLYDASGWDLGSGGFRANGLNAATNNHWLAFRTAAQNAATPDLGAENVIRLASASKQDQITGRRVPDQQVPEPAPLSLAVAAALAALWARRRARR